jgi:hypothetical protein
MRHLVIAVAFLIPPVSFAEAGIYGCPESQTNIDGCTHFKSPRQSWTNVSASPEVVIYADKSTIRRHGKYLKAWLLWIVAKDLQFHDRPYRSFKELSYFDCGAGENGVKQRLYYSDEIGEVPISDLTEYSSEEAMQFTRFEPKTLGRSVIDFVCTKALVKW